MSAGKREAAPCSQSQSRVRASMGKGSPQRTENGGGALGPGMWCVLVTLGTVISTSPGSAPAAGPAVFDEKARLQLHLLVSFAGLLSWVLN